MAHVRWRETEPPVLQLETELRALACTVGGGDIDQQTAQRLEGHIQKRTETHKQTVILHKQTVTIPPLKEGEALLLTVSGGTLGQGDIRRLDAFIEVCREGSVPGPYRLTLESSDANLVFEASVVQIADIAKGGLHIVERKKDQ